MLNDGGNLYLRAAPGANETTLRTWIFRFTQAGKDHQLSLGPYPEVSIDEARDKAAEQRKLCRAGGDPVAKRKQDKEATAVAEQAEKAAAARKTFRQCAEEYLDLHRPDPDHPDNEDAWSEPYWDQWRDLLTRFVYPVMGNELVAAVDRPLVKQAIIGVGRKPTTARKVRGQIAAVLSYAVEEEYRPEGPNPASPESFKRSLPKGKTKHHPALDYEHAPAFMATLKSDPGTAARALEFTILTASRSKEVRFAVWGEIDLAERLWTIPAARMKMRDKQDRGDHIVPLSDAAVAILETIKGDREPAPDELIFTGRTLRANTNSRGRRLGSRTLLSVVQRIKPDITAHGFRSTFTDWCGNKTDVEEEIREFALAHVKKGTAAAYRRDTAIEKRAVLMAMWADFVAGNVVEFKREAA
jgi:integrase